MAILRVEAQAQKSRPNVLFFFDDQHRTDAVSCYGGINIQTPNIDRLAREGIRFTNGRSTSPLCTPYRGMLMTGKYPTHTGLLVNFVNPHREERGIADAFRAAGYHTGFLGKWHLSSGFITHQSMISGAVREGVATLIEPEYVPPGRGRLGFDEWAAFNFHMDFKQGFYYRDHPKKEYYPDYEADWIVDESIRFLKKHKDSDNPFFLMVAPHYPHPAWRGERDVSKRSLQQISEQIQLPPNCRQSFPMKLDSPGGTLELKLDQVRTYYAMCQNIDENLGRLLDYLDQAGLSENTLLVFTSDHGEQLGSHGRKSKMVPFEDSINVPLILRWPNRIQASMVSDALYTPMDHLPTLCSLAGVDVPTEIDGIDLSPEILKQGKVQRDAVLIAHYVSAANYCRSHQDAMQWRGCRTKQYTYVKYISGRELLFDNHADPYQMTNLINGSVPKQLLKTMRDHLKKLLIESHDNMHPGTYYADWYDETRTVIRTGKGQL